MIKWLKCILFHRNKGYWSGIQWAEQCCEDWTCSKCGREWTR